MQKVRNIASRRGSDRRGGGRTERPITVRLDESRLALMTGLALIDETTVAEQIRQASEMYMSKRASDPHLHEMVDRAVARFRSSVAPVLKEAADSDVDSSLAPPPPPERDLETEKPVTLRLSAHTFEYFTSLAILDGHTVADELRAAVDLYVGQRRSDPEMERKINDAHEDRRHLLSKLQSA